MNKTEMIEAIATKTGAKKTETAEFIEAFQDVIKEALGKGDDVVLTGFIGFKVKQRAARTGRNPQTGATLNIPASKVVSIHAGKTLKEFVKGAKASKATKKK